MLWLFILTLHEHFLQGLEIFSGTEIWVYLHQHFNSEQQCTFEANIVSLPITTLGLTFQNRVGSCSFQTKIKYRKDSCGASDMLQTLKGLQSAELHMKIGIVWAWVPQQQQFCCTNLILLSKPPC